MIFLRQDKILAPAAKANRARSDEILQKKEWHRARTRAFDHDLCTDARAYGPGYIIVAISQWYEMQYSRYRVRFRIMCHKQAARTTPFAYRAETITIVVAGTVYK